MDAAQWDPDAFRHLCSGDGPILCLLGHSADFLDEGAVWVCCLPGLRGPILCVAVDGSVLPALPTHFPAAQQRLFCEFMFLNL